MGVPFIGKGKTGKGVDLVVKRVTRESLSSFVDV